MNQLLLPRFKRLMEPASWRDLSVGQAWGAVSGLCHGFALLTLLPAASSLATGMPVWGLSFWGWLIVLVAIAIVGVGTEFYGMRTGYIGVLGFIHDFHQAVGNKVARLPLGMFDSGSSGRLSRMVTQEMMNLGESAAHFIFSLVQKLSAVLVVTVGTWFWDWRLGLTLTIAFPIMLAFLHISRVLLDKGKQVSEPAESELAARMVEFATCQGALRSCHVADDYPALDQAFDQADRKGRKALWIETLANLINGMFVQALIVVMIWLTAQLALGGQMNALNAVVTIGMCLRFTTMLQDIGGSMSGLEERRQQMNHIDKVMDAPELSEPVTSTPVSAPGDVRFDDVTFGYDPDTPVLRGISFHVPQGGICALVGPSGCGKTTIARLVARFWDVQSGSVRVGGVDVREQTIEDLMCQVSLVFQDVYLFNDTLEANIRVGNPEATDEEIRWAADLSGVTEIVNRLPDGWNSLAGAGGRALSGGERQRVSIARALVKKAPIVLFDEATSALDAENEANIVAAMNELRKHSTLIVIAHKLETIRQADQIIVLSHGGHIAQRGPHDELVNQPGQYRDFWQERINAAGWQLV